MLDFPEELQSSSWKEVWFHLLYLDNWDGKVCTLTWERKVTEKVKTRSMKSLQPQQEAPRHLLRMPFWACVPE